MAEQMAQDHRLLKIIVTVLGALIVLGLGALIFGLVGRSGNLAGSGAALPLTLPQGAKIADMSLSERGMALRLEEPGGEEIILVDLKSGRVLRRFPVLRGAAGAPAMDAP